MDYGLWIESLCAAPGEAIAIAQNACVPTNESDRARHKRLKGNLKYYLHVHRFKVFNLDGTRATFENYDRILVDAPCSSERYIIHAPAKKAAAGLVSEEMLNWKSTRRQMTQLALLRTALKAVKMGDKVAYATCSISTEESDGVIEHRLEAVRKEKWAVELEDDSRLDAVTETTKYGRIVLPDHPSGGRGGLLFFIVFEKVDKLPP